MSKGKRNYQLLTKREGENAYTLGGSTIFPDAKSAWEAASSQPIGTNVVVTDLPITLMADTLQYIIDHATQGDVLLVAGATLQAYKESRR